MNKLLTILRNHFVCGQTTTTFRSFRTTKFSKQPNCIGNVKREFKWRNQDHRKHIRWRPPLFLKISSIVAKFSILDISRGSEYPSSFCNYSGTTPVWENITDQKTNRGQSEPCQTSKVEYFAEILNGILPIVNFAKCSILDI